MIISRFFDRYALRVLAFSVFGLLFVMRPTTLFPTLIILSGGFLLCLSAQFRSRFYKLICNQEYRLITWPFLWWFFSALILALVHGFNSTFHLPENEIRFFLALTVMCFACKSDTLNYLYRGLLVGAVAALMWSQFDPLIYEIGRAHGTTNNPIHFGVISALAAALCITIAMVDTDLSPKYRSILIVGAIFFVISSISSRTRTSFFVLFCILLLLFISDKDLYSRLASYLIMISLVVLLVAVVKSPKIQEHLRFSELSEAVEGFQKTDFEKLSGDRANMWHAAFLIFKHHPLIGVGPSGFEDGFRGLIKNGDVKSTYVHNQPHNDLLFSAATGGLLKLTAYIALMLGPLIFFCKKQKQKSEKKTQIPAILGMQVVLIFILTGLTNSNFDLQIYSTLYSVLICLLAMLTSLRNCNDTDAFEPSKLSTPAAPSC